VTIRDQLASFNRSYSEALAAQDFDRISDLYADDAVLLTPGLPPVRGRGAIVSAIQGQASSGPVSISFESGDVWESGDLVVDVGFYTIAGEQEQRGKYVVVLRRRPDGSLKLLVDAPSD
jgi:ketosteroid isomerase-like protein